MLSIGDRVSTTNVIRTNHWYGTVMTVFKYSGKCVVNFDNLYPGAICSIDELEKIEPSKKEHPDIELDNGGRATWCERRESYWQCGCE